MTKPQDKQQVIRWLLGRATLAEVESTERIGLVGNERFSERARRTFVRLWTWSAPRFGGAAGLAQDRLWDRNDGSYGRRIERTRRIIARLEHGAAAYHAERREPAPGRE